MCWEVICKMKKKGKSEDNFNDLGLNNYKKGFVIFWDGDWEVCEKGSCKFEMFVKYLFERVVCSLAERLELGENYVNKNRWEYLR